MITVAELSLESGSDSVAVADAVLLSCAVDCGVTRMLTIAEAPVAILPRLQVTVVVPEQGVPCVELTELKAMPEGSVSVSTAFVAGDGPLFVTTIL